MPPERRRGVPSLAARLERRSPLRDVLLVELSLAIDLMSLSIMDVLFVVKNKIRKFFYRC